MDLAAVMTELAARLRTIGEFRSVFDYPPDAISPPAAVVSWPDTVTYDQTYRRGMDRMTVPVVVLVAKPSGKAARDQLAPFMRSSGSTSVKEVLESGEYTTCHTVTVTGAEIDVVSVAAVEYLGAVFNVDIAGQGQQ